MDLVLIGAHAAGKTTLGRRVAMLCDVPFRGEIGRELAADSRWRPGTVAADIAQERFDAEVMRRELARDLCDATVNARIVETWHPGNLAYAELRSPAVVERWWHEVVEACRLRPVVVQPLTATMRTLCRRRSEPGSVGFFAEVGRRARAIAERLSLATLPVIHTDSCTVEHAAEVIRQRYLAHMARAQRDSTTQH